MKEIKDFFKKNVYYNSLVHLVLGAGIGILITYPLVGPHPLRWAGSLLVIGAVGHLYPLLGNKK